MRQFMKRFTYRFQLNHIPTGTRATFNLPAENQFEAEAILMKFLGERRGAVSDYWESYGNNTVLDTTSPGDATVEEFGLCRCENYSELHFQGDDCLHDAGARMQR